MYIEEEEAALAGQLVTNKEFHLLLASTWLSDFLVCVCLYLV